MNVDMRMTVCDMCMSDTKSVRREPECNQKRVMVVHGQAPNLKQRLVSSSLLQSGCTIHDKFVEEQEQSRRRPNS